MSEPTAEDLARAISQAKGIIDVYMMELNTPQITTRRAKENLIDNIGKAIAAALAEARGVKPGHVRTDDGVERKIIGTLGITKDGALVCDGEEVWHPAQDPAFHLRVMSIYGEMRPDSDEDFPLPDDCAHMAHYSYFESDTGYNQYESYDIRECYSTLTAANSARDAGERGANHGAD